MAASCECFVVITFYTRSAMLSLLFSVALQMIICRASPQGEAFRLNSAKRDYTSKQTQRVVKAGASAALLIPQRRRVRREEKIREEAVLRERIFIPLRFSDRVSQKHRKICKTPIKIRRFLSEYPLKDREADF
jgi:hypothetical protein